METSATVRAMSDASASVTETEADAKAGESLMPSPTIITRCPRANLSWQQSTYRTPYKKLANLEPKAVLFLYERKLGLPPRRLDNRKGEDIQLSHCDKYV